MFLLSMQISKTVYQ